MTKTDIISKTIERWEGILFSVDDEDDNVKAVRISSKSMDLKTQLSCAAELLLTPLLDGHQEISVPTRMSNQLGAV